MREGTVTLLTCVSSEITKLRTLPLAVLAAVGTVLIGAVITAALAANAVDQGAPAGATAVLQAVPFAQVGIILLGILPAAHEHAGSQFRTTLVAVPNRGLLATGKTLAALIALTVTAALTVGVSLATAAIAHHLSSVPLPARGAEPWALAGAAVYLSLIGMLAHVVALLVRHLVPALVTMLALVLVVPPLLAGVTEHARWLPDRAGSLLYLPGADTALTPGTGALVLVGWVLVIGAAAVAAFITRDA